MTRWVFLRGLSRDQRHWGNFPSTFKQAIPDAEVICLDLPGNGCRNSETSPDSVSAMVADLRQEVLKLAIPGPINLLAMSLGAMVAIEWARLQPTEISRCVLINTSLRGFNPFYQRLQPGNYRWLPRLLAGASDLEIETAILVMTSARWTPEIANEWAGFRHQYPVRARNVLRQLLAAARYRGPQSPPPTRLLLLGSTADRLVSIRCSRTLAARWSVPLIEHPAAGHDLPLDDGAWVAEQVQGWLSGAAPGVLPPTSPTPFTTRR